MRKNIILVVVTTVLIADILMRLFSDNRSFNRDSSDFQLTDYQFELNNFHSDEIVEKIENNDEAKAQAEHVWVEVYGDTIKNNKPYTVSYDSSSEVWLVTGSLPQNSSGGVPYILLKSDGKVLAVWHDK